MASRISRYGGAKDGRRIKKKKKSPLRAKATEEEEREWLQLKTTAVPQQA